MANDENRVSNREYWKAHEELCGRLEELTGGEYDGNRGIEFYFDYDRNAAFDGKPWDRPNAMLVNWSAIGTVTADEAMAFADALRTAAELAAGFKYNGYRIDYGD